MVDSLSARIGEEVTQEELEGLKERVVSAKIDLTHKSLLLSHIEETTAWSVEQVENAFSGTMQCLMPSLTLRPLLALLP